MKLQIVPARTGFQWIRLGLRTFRRQPLALAGLFFMFVMFVQLTGMLSYLGGLIGLLLLPSFMLGLMAATRLAEDGRFPMPDVLVTAFRGGAAKTRAMLVLGGLYMAGFVLLLAASALADGGDFMRAYLGGQGMTREMLASPAFERAMWAVTALSLPFSMLFWHAPALVYWHDVAPVKSLFFSFVACVRNFGAMLAFMFGWVGLMMGSVFILLTLSIMLGQPALADVLIFPVAMLLASMFFSSVWFTVRDSFVLDDQTPPDTPNAPTA